MSATKYKIKCPKCGRIMTMQSDNPSKSRKECVFCGLTFPIRNAIINGAI